jgi:hypothetical protein
MVHGQSSRARRGLTDRIRFVVMRSCKARFAPALLAGRSHTRIDTPFVEAHPVGLWLDKAKDTQQPRSPMIRRPRSRGRTHDRRALSRPEAEGRWEANSIALQGGLHRQAEAFLPLRGPFEPPAVSLALYLVRFGVSYGSRTSPDDAILFGDAPSAPSPRNWSWVGLTVRSTPNDRNGPSGKKVSFP